MMLFCDSVSQRLPISLPELVEAAPSMTADGSIILGRRQSKIYALDKHTGQVLYVIADAEEELEDHSLRRRYLVWIQLPAWPHLLQAPQQPVYVGLHVAGCI